MRNYADAEPHSGKPWTSKRLRQCYRAAAGRFGWAARTLGTSFVTFRLNAQGKVDELQMDLGGAPTTFKRRPEPAAPDVRAAGGTPR